MGIYRGVGGANEATDLATNQSQIAQAHAESAADSATECQQILDEFDDVYLGTKSSDPSTDNDGDVLQQGALYFNSSTKTLKIWDGVSLWLDAAVSEPSSFVRNYFNGNGSTTAFTLTVAPVNNDSVFVFIKSGATYVLSADYSVAGTTLTFTSAPAVGTNNVLAIIAKTVSVGTPDDGSVSTIKLQEGAVTTSKILDNNITTLKIADNAITLSKLPDGVFTADSAGLLKFADGFMTSNKLAIVSSAGSSGSTTSIPVITINNKGQVTALTSASLSRDMTGYSGSDVSLNVNEVAYYTVSSTNTIPLRIATTNNQLYEISWHTSAYGTGTTQSMTLNINNTLYASSIAFGSLSGSSLGTTTVQNFTTNALFLSLGSVGRCITTNCRVSTTTTAKSCIGNFYGFTSTANIFGNFYNSSIDTTTTWTSLGTINFGTDIMSGTLIIKRIL